MIPDDSVLSRGETFKAGASRIREEDLAVLFGLISVMQNASLVGPSGTCKTSILRRLTDPRAQREHGLDPSQFVSCYLNLADLRRADQDRAFEVMLLAMIRQTSRRPALLRLGAEPPTGDTAFSRIRSFLEQAEMIGVNLVWALDEFDAVSRNPNLDRNFFSALRALASSPRAALVTASRNGLGLLDEARRPMGSSLAGLFVTIRLDLSQAGAGRPSAVDGGGERAVPVEPYPGGFWHDSHRKRTGVSRYRLDHVLPRLLRADEGLGGNSRRTR